MNFFKLLVISIALHVTVYPYSFHSQKIDQEMFEYKMHGKKFMFDRGSVELCMNNKPFIITLVPLNVLCVVGSYLMYKATSFNPCLGLFTLLVIDYACYKEMRKFQEQAGPWLKGLQEKEALLKASQTSNNNVRVEARAQFN